MITDQNKTELIEQYLAGELKSDLLKEFTEKLESDNAFRQEVDLQRMILRSIPHVGRRELKNKLKDFHRDLLDEDENDTFLENKGKTISFSEFLGKYKFALAACISLLVVSSLFIFNNQNKNSDLYDTYYQAYPNVIYNESRGEAEVKSDKETAFTAYDAGNYKRSIELFESVLKKEKDEAVLFYLGNAYLSAGKTKEAIRTFENYLKEYKEFETEARWYLSLSYLREGREKEAKDLLNILSNSENDFTAKSKEILKKLE